MTTENAPLPAFRRLGVHPLLLVAALFMALPFLTRSVGTNIATEIVHLALYATAFNLLLGYTGVVSFGHSLFFGIGAYATGLIQLHLIQSTSLALIAALFLGAAAALLLGALIIKRKGFYFALLTLAFTQMMFTIVFRWTDLTGGEMGLQGIRRLAIGPFAWSIESPSAFYIFTSIVSFAGIAAVWMLLRTPFGKTLQGIRENEKRMRMLGCNTSAYKLAAFAISAALASVAGGLQGLLFHSTYAQIFDWKSAGVVVVMVVLGGTRYFLGPIVGAGIYVFLQHYLSSLTQHWMIVLGIIFITSLIFLPEGVASLYRPLVRIFTRGRLNPMRPADPPYVRPARQIVDPPSEPETLEIEGVSKRFGQVVVAENLNLKAEKHRLNSIIGPNGAGKTTLFNLLTGILPLDAGQIRMGGLRIDTMKDYERARAGLARSFQIVSVFRELTVFENVRLAVQSQLGAGPTLFRFASRFDEVNGRTWAMLDRLGLSSKAGTIAEQLPYGDQRLVEIAITLAVNPKVLLLDEPLAGLAEAERVIVTSLIQKLASERTVVLVEHDIDRVLAISDTVAVLNQGHLVANGSPELVSIDPEVKRVYLGADHSERPAPVHPEVSSSAEAILSVEDLHASYGKSKVLHGVSLKIRRGEIVGLLGRNGVGKTTTVMSVMGTLPADSGKVEFAGQDVTKLRPDQINRLGIGIVPQGRRIFPNLTVLENLRVAQVPGRPGRWSEDKVFEMFPRLNERRHQKGRFLSGGEQQLLAISRALMGRLDLLILDEPLEGLAPVMADLVADAIERLREENLTVLLIEQTASVALRLVDRVYVLNNGRVIHEGSAVALVDDAEQQDRLLGIHV
jgi:ABC-type branched-subunit amino acid transport system ATPase component/ABC-type branched-subunit amino acid transport system permease subunit